MTARTNQCRSSRADHTRGALRQAEGGASLSLSLDSSARTRRLSLDISAPSLFRYPHLFVCFVLAQQALGGEDGDDDESAMFECEKAWTNEALKTLRDCDEEQTAVSKVGELCRYVHSSRTLAGCCCFAVFSPCVILMQLGRCFSGSIDVRTSVYFYFLVDGSDIASGRLRKGRDVL